jgi:hypothetical protein
VKSFNPLFSCDPLPGGNWQIPTEVPGGNRS